ncbi:MAG: hypothetical protein QW303_00845 [Nitrososphaerota archaeon]
MKGRTILRIKRNASKISNEKDLIESNNNVLDLCRKIFIHHYGEKYNSLDISIYQTGFYKHPIYSNVEAEPHFVSDDGTIIYLSLMQNSKYLYKVDDQIVHLSMEILNLRTSKIFTINLKPEIDINRIDDIRTCYINITETFYRYSSEIVKNYLSSVATKKVKLDKSFDTGKLEEVRESIFSEKMEENVNVKNFVYEEWVSASKTRNYVLRDTLLDWLDHWYDKSQEKIMFNSTKPVLETEYNFGKFIMNKGKQFEREVVKLIEEKVGQGEFVTICRDTIESPDRTVEYEKMTINEISKGTPIIYQGLLMNRSGNLAYSYGSPDLLVRSDYLSKLVKISPLDQELTFFRAPKLSGNYHYVVVDLKFVTLDLCADGKRIRNSGSIPAYKCQLYIYNHALGKIQGYEPKESYILGRKYRYESKGKTYSENDCFARLGHIQYDGWDREYISESIDAISWIKRLRTEGREWKLFPKPSIPELYPNMTNSCESSWNHVKLEYAKYIGEITLLWNCGYKNRIIAHENGIYSFMDPNCSAEMVGVSSPKQAPILDEIISINRKSNFASVMDRIKVTLNEEVDNQWMKPCKLRITIDFETISSIFDDFTTLPVAQDGNYLFMIGLAYKVMGQEIVYKMFLAAELSEDAELQMVYQFYKFLRNLTDMHLGKHVPIPPLYHWGQSEKSFFNKLCDQLISKFGPDVGEDVEMIRSELEWYDLSECFRKNPIVINGCFNFGLKEVAKRLMELGLIPQLWKSGSSCTNGNMAMIMAQKAYHMSNKIPIIQNPVMKEIMEYNKADCMVIHKIIEVVQRKITDDKLLHKKSRWKYKN